jgi:hypothetical protein
MSEYHAAVGLAELEGWAAKQSALQSVVDGYRRCMTEARLSDRVIAAPDVSLSYVLFRCRDAAEAKETESTLDRRDVGWRVNAGSKMHRLAGVKMHQAR